MNSTHRHSVSRGTVTTPSQRASSFAAHHYISSSLIPLAGGGGGWFRAPIKFLYKQLNKSRPLSCLKLHWFSQNTAQFFDFSAIDIFQLLHQSRVTLIISSWLYNYNKKLGLLDVHIFCNEPNLLEPHLPSL